MIILFSTLLLMISKIFFSFSFLCLSFLLFIDVYFLIFCLPVPENLALGKSTNASSHKDAYQDELAVDGLLQVPHCFKSSHDLTYHWWSVNLGQFAVVHRVRIYSPQSKCV